jgi:ParB-like chromosome segregation protein Spo0J
MFKPAHSLLIAVLTGFATISTTYADVYKWIDDEGVTHYSQRPPTSEKAQLIKTPPPPSLNQEESAKERVNQLLEQQQTEREARQKQQEEQRQAAEQAEIKQQNCQTAKHNLQQFQDNPGRRYQDAEGNITRMVEEERQQRIQDFQKQINEFCQ